MNEMHASVARRKDKASEVFVHWTYYRLYWTCYMIHCSCSGLHWNFQRLQSSCFRLYWSVLQTPLLNYAIFCRETLAYSILDSMILKDKPKYSVVGIFVLIEEAVY